MPTPLMILSDSPLGATGLGRITRELAERIARMPEIRLGVIGAGGTSSRHLPYPLYPTARIENWMPVELPRIWSDFAGDERGILLTIWNHTWLDWLARPDTLPEGEMKTFLQSKPFERWAYVPIDSERIDGKTSHGETLSNLDRILAYTSYGAQVIERTLDRSVPDLPHGLDQRIFYPRPRLASRALTAQIPSDVLLIGVIATNTARKDWGLAFEACRELKRSGLKVVLWAHTDRFERAWDIPALARIHDIDTLTTNFHFSDEDMATAISACDLTLGIGAGEGWGYPLAESLACGVPVITGDFAGATEFVPSSMRIRPAGFRQDGVHCLRRPVYDPRVFAARAKAHIGAEPGKSMLDPKFYWPSVWPMWEEWIRKGLPQ